MVEKPLAQHAPALKVGGRRLSVSNKPKTNPTTDRDNDASEKADAVPVKEDDKETNQEEDEVPKKKNNDDKKGKEYPHWKAENTRPTRDGQGNFKSFAGQRIGQPAGKGFGV